MAKVVSRRKKRQSPQRNTNWLVLGGILGLGAILLFALLFLNLQGQGVPTPTPQAITVLNDYCAENEEYCFEKGDPNSPVTVIEVSDYACIHCRNFNTGGTADALEEQYVETGQVHWIVVPYSTNDATVPVAEAAFCAGEQDSFFEYHRAMFDQFGTDNAYTREGILSAARTAGVDVGEFESCMDSGNYSSVLQRNLAVAASAGVRATPTFFINGRLVEGNLPLGNFQQQIQEALQS